MKDDGHGFPARDEELARALGEATSGRVRSDAEWRALRGRIVAAAELPLARRRREGSATSVTEWARGFAAAAAIAFLVLAGLVYMAPGAAVPFADVSAELIELLGEDEVREYFPGMDDPDRLLEAALAAR